jgi:hypothetical protein
MARLRHGLRAAVAGTIFATALVVAAPPAHAACSTARVGTVMTICAQDLSLRRDCNNKAWMGFLYRGDRFRVDIDYGDWVWGYSYKHNRHGCVQDGWFM